MKILIPSLSMSHLHYDHSLGSALTASQKHKGIRTVLLSTFGPIVTHIDSFSTLLFTYYNPPLDSPDTGEVHNMGQPMLYPKVQKKGAVALVQKIKSAGC